MRLRLSGVSKRPPDGFEGALQFGELLALDFAHGNLGGMCRRSDVVDGREPLRFGRGA